MMMMLMMMMMMMMIMMMMMMMMMMFMMFTLPFVCLIITPDRRTFHGQEEPEGAELRGAESQTGPAAICFLPGGVL